MEKVIIFDTTLRDGEQSPGCSMNVEEKLRMAEKLVELGVDIIEAGFPIASEGDFLAVREIAAAFPLVRVAALARASEKDIHRAAEALVLSRAPRIHTFIATSDIHLQYKLKKTKAQVLEEAVQAVRLARKFADDVEFSAEDATRSDPAYLMEICQAVVEAGAGTVNIPDTVGHTIPEEFAAVIAGVVNTIGRQAIVSVHCHNDLGLAVANSVEAVRAGARQVECTINGIGERAGNCSLEELVMILSTRRDRLPFQTGVDTRQLFPASQLLTSMIDFGPQPNKAIVGENAFAHEAGIHQDGFLKERTTYEIINPLDVGVPESRLVLGKHSGRHALTKRCQELGYLLEPEQIGRIYERFTALADRKKNVRNEEIKDLIRQEMATSPGGGRDEGGFRHERSSFEPAFFL